MAVTPAPDADGPDDPALTIVGAPPPAEAQLPSSLEQPTRKSDMASNLLRLKKKSIKKKFATPSLEERTRRKAALTAYLNANPGAHPAKVLAPVLGMKVNAVAYLAGQMALSGLIVSGHKGYSALVKRKPIVQSKSAKGSSKSGSNVELVVDGATVLVSPGMQILVTRNAATGRAQIIVD